MKNKSNKLKKGKNNKIMCFFNKIKSNSIKCSLGETIIYIVIVFGIGLILGGILMYNRKSSSLALNEFTSTYNELVDNYYQKIDEDELLEAGISGMIKYLGDPYSTYMNKSEAENFNEDVDGTYQGIGAEIKYNKDNLPTIGEVFENTPAEKAGLKENDIILKVDGVSVKDKTLAEIADIVKGTKGTKVSLLAKRGNEEKEFTIIRAVVDNISVMSEVIESNNKKIGYIYISIFASNTTKQFKKELNKLEKEKIDSLIIDVRGNTGGYLTTVTDIISMFTKKDEVIYQLKTKGNTEKIYDKTSEHREYPVVVLADGGSASASELLVGAFMETYNATVVGMKTYGKGRVQKVTTLSSGALYKYTYQEWLTPKGNYIDQVGITPNIEINYEYINDNKDSQKNKAIEVLSK